MKSADVHASGIGLFCLLDQKILIVPVGSQKADMGTKKDPTGENQELLCLAKVLAEGK